VNPDEAPTVGAQTVLDNVGDGLFDPNITYTRNGVTQNMAAGNPDQIVLSPDPTGLVTPATEATPSGIDHDGDGFSDCSYQSSCATPNS
jgi:hypothetical protein